MGFYQLVVLAVIQGLTEFLPISSSAHLILPSQLFGWPDQGLAFDVAVHVGSLMAVMIYFRRLIADISVNFVYFLLKKPYQKALVNQAWFIIIGTIPALIVGFFAGDLIETHLRSILVIGATTVLFGLLLWYADSAAKKQSQNQQLTWRNSLFIGIAQAVALIPGTSRSGITMTAGLLLGLSRSEAARFSFLLSIPLILCAGGLKTVELVQSPAAYDVSAILLGVALSFISALGCIVLFLRWIERCGFLVFVIYRLLLGALLFAIAFSGAF
ncbi:undecaprenyl-diphosphate phosphatase [Reinekea thalattae]|uniref:Undecaprenyl-diphosphatase n=1 Tax=Reinekea thalattae TaxID=2593301 RepID=A0A5C8Z963_9GAMM|nr:undecaprenyl-diphosphate phosphatase [Reinekea thalattae]TXR53783.1 undecaprenyl-diphosphate phosphatase [Reinekea thalattae]